MSCKEKLKLIMNFKFHLRFLLLLIVISCSHSIDNSFKNTVVYDHSLRDSFFFIDKWSYPEFTTKDSDGKFIFNSDDEDTSHLYHTSNIEVRFDSLDTNKVVDDLYNIHFGQAQIVNDTIILEFSETTASSHDYLKIKVNNKHFASEYISGYPWINFYNLEKQTLILQKETVLIGDTLRGYLDLKAHVPKYRNLKGFFKVKVINKELGE
jgi:hypothetical protein